MRSGILAALAAASLLVLAACGHPTAGSTKDLRDGYALVLGKTYKARKTLIAGTSAAVSFRRIEPPEPKRTWFGWKGNIETVSATNALPGRYMLDSFHTTSDDIHFRLGGAYDEVEVRPGEAVYIGDIRYIGGGHYELLDNEDAARAHFDAHFADSGLTFTKRLVRTVRGLDPVLPK